jgi:hypothetical protein
MLKRVALSLALAALVLPAVASATSYDPSTRLGLLGKGDVSADLTATGDVNPVRVGVLGGTLRITKLSDDVKVICRARGKDASPASCTGQGVLALISGSHFKVEATGKLFLLGVPKGYTGSVDAATAKQCGKEIDCRRFLARLRHHAKNANGNGNGNDGKGAGGGDVTAAPGTDESIAELQAALAALGKK